MAILIGVDEAGYGPNYGPLVVAATAWRIEESSEVRGQRSGKNSVSRNGSSQRAVASPPTAKRRTAPDLYKLLRRAVVHSPDENPRRLAIADSKALYKAGLGVRQLERGVLAALMTCIGAERGSGTLPSNTGSCIARVAELLAATGADDEGRRTELVCHADDAQCLPLECDGEELGTLAALLSQTGRRCGVALAAIRARMVFPAEFNDLVDYHGTKGAALSHVTLGLVRRVVDEVSSSDLGSDGAQSRYPLPNPPHKGEGAGGDVTIFFDKHGGRNRYTALLQHHFSESWIDTMSEGRAESRYAWTHGATPIEAVFRVGCEEMLPTALASMTAKYHRELAMRAFNAWWAERIPGLRPTCGYPGDSHRFRADIAAAQRELGIEDRVLWRCR